MFRRPEDKKAVFRSPQKSGKVGEYIGKIGVIGTGGAGKTRALIKLSNSTTGRSHYHWDEAEEIMGTTTIQPYSLQLQQQVMMVDNPGQNSLEHLRKTVALSGEQYQGLVIFLDAVGWNFWNIGVQQARVILDTLKKPNLPITIIVSKWDLQTRLLGKRNLIDVLTRVIVKTMGEITPGKRLPYYDRLNNKVEYIPFSDQKTIPFTQLEQILVNGLDRYTNRTSIPELTRINNRLLIRSLLMGFCDLFRKYMFLPEFAKEHPELIIEDNIMYALNYYRPTAYETQTIWSKMAGNPKAKEPPILLESFKFADIVNIFKREVICPSQETLEEFVRQLKEQGYNIVSHVASSIIDRDSTKKMLSAVETLIQDKSFIPIQQKQKKDLPKIDKKTQKFKHKPPPKPKPVKWPK